MKRRNGFIMLFTLWTGMIIFGFSMAEAALAHQYENQIEMYSYAVEASYLAESALIMGQRQCGIEKDPDLPEKWEQNLSKLAETSGPDRNVKVVRVLHQTGPECVSGTLRELLQKMDLMPYNGHGRFLLMRSMIIRVRNGCLHFMTIKYKRCCKMKKWAQKDVVLWLSPHAIHIIKKEYDLRVIGAGLSWEIRMRKFIMPGGWKKKIRFRLFCNMSWRYMIFVAGPCLWY